MEKDRIYKGDSRDLLKSVENESIDLIISDIPYVLTQGGCATGAWGNKQMGGVLNKRKTAFDMEGANAKNVKKGKVFDFNDIEFSEYMPDLYRILKPDSHCYLMINGRNLKDLWVEAEKVGFAFQQLLVWDKGNMTPNRYWLNAVEYILMLRKGRAKNVNNMGIPNLLSVSNIIGNKKHPTEKPVELMQILVSQSSQEGDLVLDPFCGSGSTCVASRNLKRHYIGFEIDPKYYEVAVSRFEEKQELSLF